MLMLGLISKHSCTRGVTAASVPWQTADANKFRTAVSLKSSFIKHAREAKQKTKQKNSNVSCHQQETKGCVTLLIFEC